jgi:putative hemolysin
MVTLLPVIQGIVIIMLLLMSGLFSGAETAFFALKPVRVERLRHEHRPGSVALALLLREPNELLITILIGNFILLVLVSTLTTYLFLQFFSVVYLPVAMLVISTSFVVVGDIIPKSIAARQSERLALALAPIIQFSHYFFLPIRFPLARLSHWLFPQAGLVNARQEEMTLERLSVLVDMSHREGQLDEVERGMLLRTLQAGSCRVKEIMLPRTEMVSLDISLGMDGAICVFKESRYSRLPVYREMPDNIVGVLYLKDILPLRLKGLNPPLQQIMRVPYFVPESKLVINLLVEFQVKANHIALVVDEYGVLTGMVTLEDILEEVVGDIVDPRLPTSRAYRKVSAKEYIVYAGLKLASLNQLLGLSLEDRDIESVGGWVISRLGRIPQSGEYVEIEDLHITVLEAAPQRLIRLLIRKAGEM